MRRTVSCALFLCVMWLCVFSAAAGTIQPRPTPLPVPAEYVPARTTSMEGMNAARWIEAFGTYADALGIPVEADGFRFVVEWARSARFEAACNTLG